MVASSDAYFACAPVLYCSFDYDHPAKAARFVEDVSWSSAPVDYVALGLQLTLADPHIQKNVHSWRKHTRVAANRDSHLWLC